MVISHQALVARHQSPVTGYWAPIIRHRVPDYRHFLSSKQSVTNDPQSSINRDFYYVSSQISILWLIQVLLLNILQILGNQIDLLLMNALVEKINLNQNREGEDIFPLNLPPLLLLVCLHLPVQEVRNQRSQNILIRSIDTDLPPFPLVILLKTTVGIKD